MSTRKQTLIAVIVLFAITLTTIAPAQAGFLDWFTGNSAKTDTASGGSFDQLYASILTPSKFADDNSPVVLESVNAVLSGATLITGSQKTTRQMRWMQVSGYNSEVAQTDDSPFITASNTHVRDGIVASNQFPFGTVLKFPSLYGDKIFVVEDRMNKRYTNNVDIWFADKTEALQLGRRTVQIEVIK